MLYLISVFWFWLLLALVLGLAVGWFTFSRDGKGGWGGVVPWLLALVAGALVAWLKLLPTGVGYWFDVTMLFLTSYVVGCLLSGLLRGAGKGEATTPARIEPMVVPAQKMSAQGTPAQGTPAKEMAVEPAAVAAMAPAEATEEAITGLSAARGGRADDLTKIYGVDKETETKLNALGLYHYDQIAALTPGNRRWLFRQLGYEGRFPSWWWRWRYDAETLAKGAPVAAAAPAATEEVAEKPAGLAAPRGGKADDLKRIRGIGKQNEGRLHGLGIWHFDQIAAWTAEEVRWVGAFLAFPGRIEREGWVEQATILAKGGETEFSKRADKGLVATSRDDANDDGQGNVISIDKAKTKPGGKAKPAKS